MGEGIKMDMEAKSVIQLMRQSTRNNVRIIMKRFAIHPTRKDAKMFKGRNAKQLNRPSMNVSVMMSPSYCVPLKKMFNTRRFLQYLQFKSATMLKSAFATQSVKLS